jgi:hypothetical protein
MSDDPRPAQEARRLAPLPVAAAVGGGFLGAVLLLAAYAKLLDPNTFVELVRAEGLDFLLPARLVAVFALAVEVGLGLSRRAPWSCSSSRSPGGPGGLPRTGMWTRRGRAGASGT